MEICRDDIIIGNCYNLYNILEGDNYNEEIKKRIINKKINAENDDNLVRNENNIREENLGDPNENQGNPDRDNSSEENDDERDEY